jgi:aspartyl-tRNA(Asn)/glutamyl-tRNA(Gln) amidotransferase subunit B
VALMEIVSKPDMRSADEAAAYLTKLRSIVRYLGTCDGNMEEGSLRCDANVSVRPRGQSELGTRAEVKNLNSFKNVARAIEHEVARQVALVESGRPVVQETRLFDAGRGETAPLRSKEDAHDYRYFPEPDLRPLAVSPEWLAEVRASLPELPAARRERFVSEYALPGYDAGVLTQERPLADYFEAVARESGNAKAASNWIMTELLRKLKEDARPIAALPVSPSALASLIKLVAAGTISGKIAKDVFEKMWTSGEPPGAIVEREGLAQLDDESALGAAVAEIVAASPEQVASYRGGKAAALGWFVGQVMKKTGGRANPQRVNALLKKALDGDR